MKITMVWTLILLTSSVGQLAVGATILKQPGTTAQKDGFLKNTPVLPDPPIPETPDHLEKERERNLGAIGEIGSGKLFPKESQVPKIIQYLLAIVWVIALGVMPLVLPLVVDKRELTATEMILGCSTIIVTFGGFFLFTHVVLFQSSHFEEIRPLTIIECIYFMAQVVTTIGYGDIGPAKTRGQFFVGFYCIFALFVIAMTIQEIAEHLVKIVQKYKKQYADQEAFNNTPRAETVHKLIAPKRPSAKAFLTALGGFMVIDIVFVIFFSMYPGEDKTVLEALYMSLITLGSIGFGFFTPLTEGGMIFASFSMLIGCAAMMFTIGEFGALVYQFNAWEQFNKKEVKESKEELENSSEVLETLQTIVDGSDKVTELQFLQFVLVQKSKVSNDEVKDILRVFGKFKPKNGSIALAELKNSWQDVQQWPESQRRPSTFKDVVS